MRAYTLTYAGYGVGKNGVPAVLFFDTDPDARVRKAEARAAMHRYLEAQDVTQGILRCAGWIQTAAAWKERQDAARPRCTGWVFWTGGFLQPAPPFAPGRHYVAQGEFSRVHLAVLGQSREYLFDSNALAKSCTHVMRDVQGCPCEDRPTMTYLEWNAKDQFCRNFVFLPPVYEGLRITEEQYMLLGKAQPLSVDTEHHSVRRPLGEFTYVPASHMTTEPARGWQAARQPLQDIYPQGIEASREARQDNARKAAATRRLQRTSCPSCVCVGPKGKSCGSIRSCGGTRTASDVEQALKAALAKDRAVDLRTIDPAAFTPSQVSWLLRTAQRTWDVRDSITRRTSELELGYFRPSGGRYRYTYGGSNPVWEFAIFRTANRRLRESTVFTSWETLTTKIPGLADAFCALERDGKLVDVGLTAQGVFREDLAVLYGGVLRRNEWGGYRRAGNGRGSLRYDIRNIELGRRMEDACELRLCVDVHSATRIRRSFEDRWTDDGVETRASDWFGSASSSTVMELLRSEDGA